ncbi:MAG: flagellar basal body-associated FliL family protein [Rickettsiales bacterium]|nr:flagellar basal body-associated FliL family protein [Rickettsiales bacterium]
MAKAKPAKEETEEKEEKTEQAEGTDGEGGEEGSEQAPKKSKKKLIIFGAIGLVILLAAGGGAYYFLGMGKHAEEAQIAKSAEKRVYYNMPEFLVNLNSGGKQASFLKITVVLELASQQDVLTVEANLPRLFDTLNTYLRELRAADLAGSAGIQRLREELMMRSNQVLAPTKINDILFKQIVVQ